MVEALTKKCSEKFSVFCLAHTNLEQLMPADGIRSKYTKKLLFDQIYICIEMNSTLSLSLFLWGKKSFGSPCIGNLEQMVAANGIGSRPLFG